MNLDVSLGSMKLYNGRRSYAAHITVNRRSLGLYRWDTQRIPPNGTPAPWTARRWHFDLWRGAVMTWYLSGWTIARKPAKDDGD